VTIPKLTIDLNLERISFSLGGKNLPRKYFTIDEVNQLLPQLEHHFRKLLQNKREMAKVALRLKRLGAEVPLLEEFFPDSRPEVEKFQRDFVQNYRDFKEHILAVEALGGNIKDLELGRVEFLSRGHDKLSLLTWQLGVTEMVHSEEIPLALLKEEASAPIDSSADVAVQGYSSTGSLPYKKLSND